MRLKLNNPPNEDRSRELWLQHAAGLIIFEDIRKYAINEIPEKTDEITKEKIIEGIDNAIYGLMMIMDGVTGTMQNEDFSVRIENRILLESNGKRILEIDTLDGDGMCMGFHGWKEGDFGSDKIVS